MGAALGSCIPRAPASPYPGLWHPPAQHSCIPRAPASPYPRLQHPPALPSCILQAPVSQPGRAQGAMSWVLAGQEPGIKALTGTAGQGAEPKE